MAHIRRPIITSVVFALLVAAPLAAQTDERVRALEQRLDELARQMAAIRSELDSLKGAAAADLTAVELAPPAAEAPPPAAPSLTDVQTVTNQPAPGASKVFNPDISVIGNFAGRAGAANVWEFGPGSERASMELEEVEIGLEAFVDPYAKARFFLAASPEGLEVEEGYASFLTLPAGLTAKAGRMKAAFGKANTWHTHTRPWIDQPLMIHNAFGDEQLADSGVSFSRVIPASGLFAEVTAEVFRGEAEGVFEPGDAKDLASNVHLKLFRDLSESRNVELGGSWARGTAPDGGTSQFGGIDLTYRWKPLGRPYGGLVARAEALLNDRSASDQRLRGMYASLDWQLARRWYAGVRLDRGDRLADAEGNVLDAVARDRGASAILTFRPSEFSQLRTQLRRTSYGDVRRSVTELLFHLQFAIGPHGAHTF